MRRADGPSMDTDDRTPQRCYSPGFCTLSQENERLREVIGRLLYTSGPITQETPCRCGATQPAHYCDYEVEARRDALRLLDDLTSA